MNWKVDFSSVDVFISFFVWSVCVPVEVACGEGGSNSHLRSLGRSVITYQLLFLNPKGPRVEVILCLVTFRPRNQMRY